MRTFSNRAYLKYKSVTIPSNKVTVTINEPDLPDNICSVTKAVAPPGTEPEKYTYSVTTCGCTEQK